VICFSRKFLGRRITFRRTAPSRRPKRAYRQTFYIDNDRRFNCANEIDRARTVARRLHDIARCSFHRRAGTFRQSHSCAVESTIVVDVKSLRYARFGRREGAVRRKVILRPRIFREKQITDSQVFAYAAGEALLIQISGCSTRRKLSMFA